MTTIGCATASASPDSSATRFAEMRPAKWAFARMLVESMEAIAREHPRERLVAITRELRAAVSR